MVYRVADRPQCQSPQVHNPLVYRVLRGDMFFPFARVRRDHDSGKRIRNDRHSDLDAVVGAWAFILFRQRIEAVVRAQGSTSIGAFGVTVHREGAGPHLVIVRRPAACQG